MTHLCIYHKSCPDGFGAALAVKVFLDREHAGDKQEWLAAHHDDDAPDVKGKRVYIVDFAYKRDTLIRLHKEADSLVVIDHHVTAEADLKGLDFCHFDMSKSGAMLSWLHFNKGQPIPKIYDFIQDRDLWSWKLPLSREFSAGLELYPMTFDDWSPLLADNSENTVIEQGKTVLAYQQIEVDRAVKKGFDMVTICGYSVPCINTSTLVSDIGHELCQGHPFAALYFETKTKRVYSLRSAKDGIDVSKIAEQFGGGGHFHAAGFAVDKPKMEL